MKRLHTLALGILWFPCWIATAQDTSFTITDEFVRYIQSATNPDGFGLSKDGRFKPYSTPMGRRIGYRQRIWDESLYDAGCTKQEAEMRLRADLQQTLVDLSAFLATNVPSCTWKRLAPEYQEILVDLASSEGVSGLKPAVIAAAVTEDGRQLIDGMLYIRMFGSTLDNLRNRAFAQRWIESGRLTDKKGRRQGDEKDHTSSGR